MTTSEETRETVRRTVSGPFFSSCAVQLYLHADDRKRGGDKENPEMPHGEVKIGHLARETVREGEERNQKEGKKLVHACLVVGTFLLQAQDKTPSLLASCLINLIFAKRKMSLLPLVELQRNNEHPSVF